MIQSVKLALLMSGALVLGACATKPALYSWGPYENQVYAHFKNESPEEQILILERHAQETQASGKQLPPGYRAHLGLLYAKVGREGEFFAALEQEKTFFPESAPYVDRLLLTVKKKPEVGHDKK
jgi:hypothetical protein